MVIHKKGYVAAGAIFLLVVVGTFLLLPLSFSSAVISQTSYVLGDTVKVDLSGITDYKIKIQTPSTVYLKEGSDEVFIFKAEELGQHRIILQYEETQELYEFNVVSSAGPQPQNTPQPPSVSENIQNGVFNQEENQDEFDGNATKESSQEEQRFTTTDPISVGTPVRHVITEQFLTDVETALIQIPSLSEDITVYRVSGETKEPIEFSVEEHAVRNTLTRIVSLNQRIGFTTLSIGSVNELDEIEIEYYTPAPLQQEKTLSETKKEITVSSANGLAYEHVFTATTIPEIARVNQTLAITVFWKEEKQYLEFDAIDTDGNGLIDRIEWFVPHLSEQTFEVGIDILNVQSYPVVGGLWNVAFTTIGTANLTIEASNGTTWENQGSGGTDLGFIRLTCGDEPVAYEWVNGTVFVEDYECDDTSIESSRVLTEGPHTISFTFGDITLYAFNEASLYQLIGEWGTETNVEDTWSIVNFNHTFNDTPVVVHSPDYDYTYTDNPCHPRIRNINTTSFELRSESWDSGSFDNDCPSTGFNVYWLAMEKGIHTLSDNGTARRTIEVTNFTMSSSACGSGANPADYTLAANQRTFQHAWVSEPIVLSAVQTGNDLDPIASYITGCGTTSSIWSTTCVETGLNGMENDGTFQPCTEHTSDEEGGYIAWETDANWTDAETLDNNGTFGNGLRHYYWEAIWESDNVEGTQNDPPALNSYFVTLTENWSQGAAFGSGIRIDGGNGILPTLDYDAGSNRVYLIAEEDENGDSEQSHTAEPWQVLFFNASSGFLYSNETNPAPVITDVNSSEISDSSARINWTTDIIANSTVEYGTTLALGSSTGSNTLVANHSVLVSSLSATTTYFYNVTSCSEFGICNTSGTFNFTTIIGTPPTIFNITPTNLSNVSSPVVLSASTSEDADCEYSTSDSFVYGTGTNFSEGDGTTFHNTSLGALGDGTYTYYIKCEDGASNANNDTNQGSTTFTVDATAPTIILGDTRNGDIDEFPPTFFNWTVSDNLATSLTCDFIVDDSTQESDISISNGSTTSRTSTVGFGPHNWTITCYDSVNNSASETGWFFYGEPQTSVIAEVGTTLINASDWATINLTQTFVTPVVVTSNEFQLSNSFPPVSVRITNVTSSSFQAILQLANSTATASEVGELNLSYLVVEEGFHFMEDGTRIEAYSYATSTVASSGNGWSSADSRTYNHTYSTNPVIFHQVMTYNDANWITTFVSSDGNEDNPPNSTNFQISLNGAEAFNSHGSETIGYVVVELANGTNNDMHYETGISGLTIQGVDNDASCSGSYTISFNNTYGTAPFVISSQQSMLGNNGGWSHDCSRSTTLVSLRIEEDQLNDDERAHTSEYAAIFVFNDSTVILSNTSLSVPVLSDVNASNISDSSAVITWNTNISSNSTVYFGLTNDTYSVTGDDIDVLNHSVTLVSLMENTTYFYVVESCDVGCNVSGTYNFTTGVGTPPLVFNITPTNDSITLNPVLLSASTSENADCEYSTSDSFVYGTGTNFSEGDGTTFHNTSLGSLSEGTHTYYIKCEDSNGNANNDTNQGSTTFHIDETAPSITLHHPEPGDSEGTSVFFNFTVTDNIDSVLVCNLTANSIVIEQELNATNGSVTNQTETLSEGAYNWNVTCYDDAGNANTSLTQTFSVGSLILVNVSTDAEVYNQGTIGNISVNTTDLLSNPLVTNTTTDIIYGNLLANSTVWWNTSWNYRQAFRIQENSGAELSNYQINLSINTQSLITNETLNTDCSDIRVVDSNNMLLPFYVQNSSYNGCNTTITSIWAQLDSLRANASSLVYVYYGNNVSSWVSDEYATFNYSTHQNIYYTISTNITDVDVVSFVDGNNVSNGTDYVSLNRGDVTTLGANNQTIISATGPIFAESDDNTADALLPISFAGTEFVYGVNRNTDIWHVHSPFGNAEVCVYDGNDGAAWTLVGTCFTVNQGTSVSEARNIGGTTTTLDETNTDTVYINSTSPVLIMHETTGPSDGFPLYPAASDWWGVPSTRMVFGILTNNTNVQIYYSNGSNQNISRNAGEDIYLDGFSTGGQDVAVHVISNNLIGVVQEADQDGSETTTFLPEHELDTEYYIPQTASYIAVAATYPNTNCTLYDETDTIVSSGLTTGNNIRPAPSKWYYGPDHSGNNIAAGSRLACDQPVYAYYEQFGDGGDDEERNIFGIKSFRKHVPSGPTITENGSQELFIERNISVTNALGIGSFLFDTTGHALGNYSAVTLAERFSFDNGTGQIQFEIIEPLVAEPPNVTLTNPAIDSFHNNETITLFYNATDTNDNIANSTLILNGAENITNETVVLNGDISNFTITLPDGFYTWNVNVTDDTNLVGTSPTDRNFTIDTGLPNITLYEPLDGASIGQSDVFFNFSVIDNIDLSLTCDLVIDGTAVQDDFAAANGTVINFTETVGAGLHFWNVTCTDDASNNVVSETRNFTVTEEPPTVELITANNTYTTVTNITLVYNATDNNDIAETLLILDGVINQTNQTAVENGNYSNFTVIGLVEGSYDWTVNATDTAGFNATAAERRFIVDLNDPIVTLNEPIDNFVSNVSSLSFNFTVTDSIDTSLTCNLTVGEQTDLNFAATNGSLTNRAISSLTDGLKIWNVTCVDDSGRSGFSGNRNVNISEPPSSIVLNTANNSFYNISSFNLDYTPTDNTNFSSCDLYINGAFNQTNQSAVTNGALNTFNYDSNEGIFEWSILCTDLAGLQNQSETRLFTVDFNPPSISLSAPLPDENLFVSSVEFNFTVIDNIDLSLTCNITVNGVVEDANFAAANGSITNRSVAFSEGGFKLWNVSCLDDSGNFNVSATQNFTLSFAPQVTLTNPDSDSFHNDSSITLFYSVQDDNNNINGSFLLINDLFNASNQSAVINEQVNNFTVTLPDGFYNWTVNVTDDTGLEGTDSNVRNFTIDTQAPNITLGTPLNNSVVDWNNFTYNFTVTDNIDTLLSCDIYANGVLNHTVNATAGAETLVTSILPDGDYLWNVTCTDDAINTGESTIFNFTMEAPPNVTLVSPVNNFSTNQTSITFRYFVDDPIGITNCSIYIDDVLEDSTTEPSVGSENSFIINSISEANHNWTVECFDASPDFNPTRPAVRNFSVDQTAPLVTLLSPLNDSNALPTTELNFTVSDNLDLSLDCDLYLDGALNISNITAPNGTVINHTLTGLAFGLHTWNVSCVDSAQNQNFSATWQFNVTLADLFINTSDIVFNNTEPTENESVLINGTVHNLVDVAIHDVVVQFYDGDPDVDGTQIETNQTISEILGSSNATVSVVWNATLGTTEIFVLVDPPIATNGSIAEVDETNNEASNNITVGAWQFVYGEISESSVFEVADQENSEIIIWNATNFDQGNIYVADSESSISWLDLQALGQTSADADSFDDFNDVDTLFNMTSFIDSISLLYTNGSDVFNTTSLFVFNLLIDEVPLTNSTNNTNFQTGILWDTSDDVGDGEFSQDDTEDLLFVTEINKGQVGTYGTYDYEIRIPARLRDYAAAGDSRVAFYIELN